MAHRKPLPLGEKFGRLTVVEESHRVESRLYLRCVCECGGSLVVHLSSLRTGATKSCGCLRSELSRVRQSTHGLSSSRFYKIWLKMRERCHDPHAINYERYGALGIRVCERWQKFEHFRDDMHASYQEHVEQHGTRDTSIDRIENALGYLPGNCRWATEFEQRRNKSTNHLIEFNGRTQALHDWGRETGLGGRTIYKRLQRGWSVERALTEPRDDTRHKQWRSQ